MGKNFLASLEEDPATCASMRCEVRRVVRSDLELADVSLCVL